ncbi:hypothetical protein VSQ48_12980 [Candidatus Ventrimonas sp. KK005]
MFLLIIMLILSLRITHLFRKHSDNTKLEKQLFWLGAIFILCVFCIRYPELSWQAEPEWETFTNLIHQTFKRGSLKNSILLDDAGYWPFCIRIIAFFAIKFFPVQYIAIILQMFSTICAAMVCMMFVKKDYNTYFTTAERFIVCLFLGGTTFLAWFQVLQFHNFGYLASLFILMCYMANMDDWKKSKLVIVSVITIFWTISKAYYIGLIPIVIFVLLISRKNLSFPKKFYLYCSIIGPICSLTYILLGISENSTIKPKIEISSAILGAIYDYLQSYLYFGKPFNNNGYFGGVFYNILVLIIVFLIFKLVLNAENKYRLLSIGLNLWAFGSLFVLRYTGLRNFDYTFYKAYSITNSRSEFLIFISILFLLLILFAQYQICYGRKLTEPIFYIIMIGLTFHFSYIPNQKISTNYILDYFHYAKVMNMDSYAIPVGVNHSLVKENTIVYCFSNKTIEKNSIRWSSLPDVLIKFDDSVKKVDFLQLQGNISQDSSIHLLSIYAKKDKLSQGNNVLLKCYNQKGQLIQSVEGVSMYDRYAVGFFVEKTSDISYITFETENNNKYYVKPEILIAIEEVGTTTQKGDTWGNEKVSKLYKSND